MHHLDPELLQAALAGDIPVKVLVRQLLAHVGELCPECEASVRWLRQSQGVDDGAIGTPPLPRGHRHPEQTLGHVDPRFVGAFDRGEEAASRWASRVRRERKKAREDVRELLRLPREKRRLKIERAHTRFRSRAVVDLLYAESRRLIRARPDEARDLAELIEVVLRWMPGGAAEGWARETGVLAQAWVANTHRVEYDFAAADRVFREVRARMEREVVGEGVHGEVASLEASLRFDQGRCEEARALLDQAEGLFRLDGDRERLAKVFVQRALLEDREGEPLRAVDYQRQALDLVAGEGSAMEREFVANLALFLVNGERVVEAGQVLLGHRAGLAAAGLWEEPRLQSIRGRIALGLGREQEAEELFLAARAELIRRGDAVRAAVASLDLAVLYLAQGKTVELRRIARLMGSIFETVDLEDEALAAVVLFQQAVAQDALTEAALRSWRRQLEVGGLRRGRKAPS